MTCLSLLITTKRTEDSSNAFPLRITDSTQSVSRISPNEQTWYIGYDETKACTEEGTKPHPDWEVSFYLGTQQLTRNCQMRGHIAVICNVKEMRMIR